MKAAKKDFYASNNTPWDAEITVLFADGTSPDLSVYDSFAMHVKTDEFDPEPQVTPTVTLVGTAALHIEHALNDDLAQLWGSYVYDIIGLDGSGDPVDTIMSGTITGNQGVTVV
jgi:hypothetical protein